MMPYFSMKQKEDVSSAEEEKKSSAEEEEEKPDDKGADLLLTLAETAKEHAPKDAAITPSPDAGDRAWGGPGFSVNATGNHNLYPSPIKLNRGSPTTMPSPDARTFGTRVWSPAACGSGDFAGLQPHSEPNRKRPMIETLASNGVGSEEESKEEQPEGKKRLISPSSSNDKTEEEDLDGRFKYLDPRHQQSMYPPGPYGSSPNGYGYPPPPYPYRYPPGAPHPPPGAFPPYYGGPMYGLPGAPSVYAMQPPPYNSMHPDAKPDGDTISSQHAIKWRPKVGADGAPLSSQRCVPLEHPIPSRYWGKTENMANFKLPDFCRLVNFPDYLARGRISDCINVQGQEGKKHCVMCGKLRVCSASSMMARRSAVKVDHEAAADHETTHIIPRQNKGVCTACDVTVWVVLGEPEGLEIKWCKGCKNFRPWAAFGDKGSATKCVRCRNRQKEKYATQKNAERMLQFREEKKEDDVAAKLGL